MGELSHYQEDTQPVQCPIDQTELMMTERNGVEIDYCPKCRGVWLDRGELDKIIDRAANALGAPPAPAYSAPDARYRDDRSDRTHDERHDERGRKRKKRSFLDDLFDFD